MLKWILLIVIVVAFHIEVGHLLADVATIAKDTITLVIQGFKQ